MAILHVALLAVFIFFFAYETSNAENNVKFRESTLEGAVLSNPTSLQFGRDGRLYVSEQKGKIHIFTVQRVGQNNYEASAMEPINVINTIPNHNDDGTLYTSSTDRQVTGILLAGTAKNPVIYVSSSDPRMGGAETGDDKNLDTNSGVVSKLLWNGSAWLKTDIVLGLPRSEENHAVNGMQLDQANNILYLAVGGNTNAGSPSNNFAFLSEYALSAAILKIDLTAIDDQFGGTYILPTLDDPTRSNTGPNGSDENDPFGGNDGGNQAKLVPGGPVQIHSPGYRNAYDLVITEAPGKENRMYTIDNGANGGWGGHPDLEGGFGDPLISKVTNKYVEGEPGSIDPGPNDDTVNNLDNLHLVSKQGMAPIYGGHANPIRANPSGAGLYWFDNNTNSAHFALKPTVDWPPVPLALANPVEGDFRNPGVDDGALYTWPGSTNGIAEYRSSKFFNGDLAGDLLAVSFDGNIYRIKLSDDGTSVQNVESLASGLDSIPLDVTAQGPGSVFEGTMWVANYGSGNISIFEPVSSWEKVVTVDNSAPIARHENSFVELNRRFYLIGGRETTTVNIYDPALNAWTAGAGLPFILHHFQAVSWNNKIYVIGAFQGKFSLGNVGNSESPVRNIYVYDPVADEWTKGPTIPRPRGSVGVVVHNDEFYMFSGIVNGHADGWVDWVDKYDPRTDTWEILADAPRARDHFEAVMLDGNVYLIGGRKTNVLGDIFGGAIPEVDIYSIATNSWTTLPPTSNVMTPRAGAASIIANGEIYLIGGESSAQSISHHECEIFSPGTGRWRKGPYLMTGRHGTNALVYQSAIYIAGGSANRGGGPVLPTMEKLAFD